MFVVGGGMANQALTFISGPLIARILGPTGRGEVVSVLAVSLIASQVVLASLPGAISRAVAASHAPALDAVGSYLRGWIAWAGLCAFLAAIGTAVVLRDSGHVLALSGMAFLLTLAGGVTSLLRAMAYGEHGLRRAIWADLAFTAAYVAVVAALFVFSGPTSPLVTLVGYCGAQVFGLVMMRRALQPLGHRPEARASRQEIHRFARASYFSSLGALDRLGFDSVIVGQLLGAAALGLYSVASSIGTLPAVMVGLLAAPLLPKMVAITPQAGAALMRRWLLYVLGMCALVVPVLWVLIPPALRIFFGSDFVGAGTCARLLLLANAAFGLRLVLGAAALAQDREKAVSMISLLAMPTMLGALALGAHYDGLTGAALGMIAVSVATCAAIGLLVSWNGAGVVRRTDVAADAAAPSAS
ncbi:hypothetical protein GCM10028801_11420 [Nocardioides maradonensis]